MTYDKNFAKTVLGAQCETCPLNTVGRFVPSVGPVSAEVAYVGEAPGVNEAREGIPFTGPSGRLLNMVNNNYGIKREEVFLSNACLCRPPNNDTPTKAAIAACRPRLVNELQGRSVTTTVALGNSAAFSLLGVEGVTKLRIGPGRTSRFEGLEGIRIIPTLHPAACLRQSDMFPSLVADVAKVVTPHVPWNEPNVRVIADPMEAIEHLAFLQARADELVVDIEVDIDKESSFDHPDRYDLLCVGLCHEDDEAVVLAEGVVGDERVREAMGDAFRASKLIGQNGKFDLAALFYVCGSLELFFDTMLASYCLDERPGLHGLKYMAVEYLGAPQYDEDISKYVKGATDPELEEFAGYGRIPRDILYTYCGYDVVVTWKMRHILAKRMEAVKKPFWWDSNKYSHYAFKTLHDLHDFLVAAGNELMYLELNGIVVDRTYLRELWDRMEGNCQSIEDQINEILIKDNWSAINPRSPQQVKKTFTEHFGARVPDTAKDTVQLLTEQMLSRYGEDAYQKPLYNFSDSLLKYRDEHKQFSTYVKGIHKRLYRGRVYSTFLLRGTTTGRLASRNPNLQNIPRRKYIKQMFIPTEGNVFVQADYAQAELRIVTWLADEPYFRDVLNDPTRDLFDELTPLLNPQLGSKEEVDPEEWKDIRVRVKAFVYGLNYGREPYSIAQEFRMSEQEARGMKDNFFQVIPNIVEWQDWVQGHVKQGRDLINPFGRHRRFHLVTQENWKSVKKEALAFLPQSTSSDVCLRALIPIRRDLRGSGAYIRNVVHDSILIDCPPDMANDVATLLDKHMVASGQELVGDYIDFKTDVKIGKHWGEV